MATRTSSGTIVSERGQTVEELLSRGAGWKALLCLETDRPWVYGPGWKILHMGVAVLLQRPGSGEPREIWQLSPEPSGSLAFKRWRAATGRKGFASWSRSIGSPVSSPSPNNTARPQTFLRRYLLQLDPMPKGSSTCGEWIDLADTRKRRQAVAEMAEVAAELRRFQAGYREGIPDCVVAVFSLPRRPKPAGEPTLDFRPLRAAVVESLCADGRSAPLPRAQLVAHMAAQCSAAKRLPVSAGYAEVALDRVLAMDSWCEAPIDGRTRSAQRELHAYTDPATGGRSYGLLAAVACSRCGSAEEADLALCDACGHGAHRQCMPPRDWRRFQAAAEKERRWLCPSCVLPGTPGRSAQPASAQAAQARTAAPLHAGVSSAEPPGVATPSKQSGQKRPRPAEPSASRQDSRQDYLNAMLR
mmetsp:Transcript_27247/g.70023  ORF Transcript_27247/g.70023 Transcript_27247/m.70023 type:complete len:415 (-) Transcript_27247:262-1506(-)